MKLKLSISIVIALLLALSVNVVGTRAKSDATCTITPYSETYDGSAHTATGSCTDVNGEPLSGLDLSATTHTEAGDYPSDAWTFTDVTGNYNDASGTVNDIINQATATCDIDGFTGTYDGDAHGASGSCTIASGSLPGLSLGLTFSNVPGGTANWTFTNPNVSNSPQSGSVDIKIDQAPSTTTVTCPESVTYTGLAQTPCTAKATGVGMSDVSLTPTYADNIIVGTATASASWTGDPNHDVSSNLATFEISQASSSVTVTCTAGAPYTYTGSAQRPCTAEATGAGMSPVNVSASLVYGNNTNAGAASADASWDGDANHTGNNGSGGFTIDTATATCDIDGFTGIYTGAAFGASGSCKGVKGETLSGLDLGSTFTNFPGGFAHWTFRDVNDNYNDQDDYVAIYIAPASSTTTVTCPASETYTGSALIPCSVTVTGANLNLTPDPVYANNIAAGINTASASYTFSGDGNHTGSSDSKNFTIDPAPSTTTVTCPASVTYTGLAQTPCTAEATSAGMSPVNVSASLVYGNNTNPGTATANASWGGDSNHTASNDSATFVIMGTATVSAVANSRTYGAVDPSLTVTYSGFLPGDLPFITFSATRVAGENAGTYLITPSASGAPVAYYTITYNTAIFTINKATATVSAVANTKTYGAVDPTLTTTNSGFLAGDLPLITFSATRAAGESVAGSPYQIRPSASGAVLVNYTVTYVNANFTITRALTTTVITCPPGSFTYTGTNIRPCSAITTRNSDGFVVQTDTLRSGNQYTPSSAQTNVGTYTANQYTYSGTSNYLQSIALAVTFQIIKAPSTVQVTCPPTVAYTGSALTPCTARYFGAGFSNNGVVFTTPPLTYSNNVNVGTATANAITWPGDANHTSSSSNPVTFEIKLGATVTAVANTKIYGTVDPPLTVTYSGFLPEDLPNISFSATRAAGEDVGTYTITSSASGAPLANYSVNYVTATFTITQALSITTVTCPVSRVYTGSTIRPCSATVTGVGGSVIQSTTMSSQSANQSRFSYSYSNNTNVGTASATYIYKSSNNYSTSTGSATFQIIATASTVTVTCPVSVGYTGTEIRPCSATVAGVSNPVLTWTYTNNLDIGTATAVADFDGDANHGPGSGSGTFQITAPRVDCTVTRYNVTYDGVAHTATGSCIYSEGGIDLSTFLDLSATTHTNAGSYSDQWTFHDDSGTYPDASGTVSDVIAKANANCDASGFSFYFGPYTGTPHGAAGNCTGVNGEDLSAQITSTALTNVGIGFVTWTFNGGTNYYNDSGIGLVIITRADSNTTVTCTISGYTGVYDGQAHGASGTCRGIIGEDLSGSVNLGSKFTNVPGGTAHWTFSNSNYTNKSGDVSITLSKAPSLVSVSCPATPQPYTGSPLTPCTAMVTGVGGLNLPLTVSYSPNTDAGTVTASATYAGDANHESSSGSASFEISKVPSLVTVTCPTSVTYTGLAQTPCTAVVTGVGGLDLPLTVSYSSNTDVGTATASASYEGDTNHESSSGSATFDISKADATCTIMGWSGTYDGAAHGASGSCTGVMGETLSGLDLGSTFTNVPGGTANWTFTNANYNDQSGSVSIIINQATATCTVTPYSVTYDGAEHTVTGACIGAQGETLSGLDLSGTTHTDAGEYPTDAWTFTDVTGNYNNTNGTVHDSIAKADATCTVTPYTVTYDGNPHTATGSCLGVKGESLSGLDLSGTTHTNAGNYTDGWTFTDVTGNYKDTNGTVLDSIARAEATCTVTAYTVTYDGNPHTATGSCLGVKGETLSGLDLSATTHTDAGDYPSDAWGFTDVTGNYNNTSGTVPDSIARAEATCTINGYSGIYDGNAHGATGTCTGVKSETLSGLNLGETFTDVPGGNAHWTFSNANYNDQSGDTAIVISKADATCTVIGVSNNYDGAEHSASGACTGVKGETLSGLNLGETFDDVPGGNAHWTFTGGTNYNDQPGGDVVIAIHKAPSHTTVTCPESVPFTGSAQTPCHASVSGAGLYQDLTVFYNSNTNVGTAAANSAYAGDDNHTGSNDSETFTITSGTAPVIPGIGAEETPTATSVPATSTANRPEWYKQDSAVVGSDMKTRQLTNETQASPALPTLTTAAVIGSDQGTVSAPVEPATVGESQSPKILSTLSGSLGCIGAGFLGLLIFFMFKRRKKEDQE
jgi:hypothetical protein